MILKKMVNVSFKLKICSPSLSITAHRNERLPLPTPSITAFFLSFGTLAASVKYCSVFFHCKKRYQRIILVLFSILVWQPTIRDLHRKEYWMQFEDQNEQQAKEKERRNKGIYIWLADNEESFYIQESIFQYVILK